MSYAGSIYSPDTAGTAAADQALVLRQQEHQQLIQEWQRRRMAEQAELDRNRREIEEQKQVVLRQQAENWTETDRLRAERNNLQHDLSVAKRDKELLVKRDQELQIREDLRRRNRTMSAAYIEDSFATLSPRSVVEHLTHSSPRVRKHVIDNISTCINGFKDATPPLVRFKAEDIAPFLLPKLHQLVSVANKPVDSIMRFAEDVVSSPPMAKALALCGDCPRLADYLIQKNEFVNRLAISSLRQMIRSETMVVKAAYDALAMVIPLVPVPESSPDVPHLAVEFIEEMAPKIIGDCFHNSLWNSISPLATHRIESIRRIALPKIVFEAQHSDRTRHGLVEANTLGLLDQQYQLPSPPSDVVDFFVSLLPLLADKICRRTDNVLWLLRRLGDPNPKINTAVVEALRTCSMKQDVTILDIFVKAELLRRLDGPPTQPSFAITRLICELLPVLAIPHARHNQVSQVVVFLDHAETAISNACLVACMKIVDSTVENRARLHSVFSKLNFAKESTLKLCDYAMPFFCKDWAATGDFAKIAKLLSHSERRVRIATHRVWNDVISNTPSARAKIVRDDLLGVIFELCSSPYEDCVVVGCQSVPHMAIEVVKAGTGSTRQLVAFLNHPRMELRRAALKAIQVISESNNANCDVLLSADAFDGLKQTLETNPHDDLDTAHKILVRLAPFLSKLSDACSGLLQLLDSKVPQVESATRAALASISYTNIEYRETLRNVVLDRLLLASDALIEFTVQAIRDWIGPDLAQLNDFATFFDLVSHSDKRIQTAALFSLRQRIPNREYQESLERANIIFLIRSLSSNDDNPEAISFVAFALPSLALTLAHNGHVDDILLLLGSTEPQIRQGASAAIESIANGSVHERKHLLNADILERLIGSDERIGQTELQLCSTIIPKIALDYLRVGKVDLILTLVDHHQQHIRVAANRSVAAIVGGAADDRTRLRRALLPRLNNASATLREVAAMCLSRVLARDLVLDGDYTQLFHLFGNEDLLIRAPIIAELRTFIQGSDETVRKHIVEADILPAILHAESHDKDDLILFTAECVLPVLGPSFSQNDGGSSIIPLLNHKEPRIRTAAATALKNGVDSRHGNVENMARAGIILKLYPAMNEDDAIRDLWCHLLPKAAPFLSVRAEIDVLFESLGDHRDIVRQSAAEAISTMAKTSEDTRLNLFPALMHHLDERPPDYALGSIAHAVSLSGSAFVSNGKEAELLYIIEHGDPALVVAAVDAVTQLLSKGSSYEHRKLMEAEVFIVAIRLHQKPSERKLSLKLLCCIIPHLSYTIILDEGLAEELFSLFDDPDSNLSQTLYQALTSDPRVSGCSNFPELLPLLLDTERMRNPSVSNVLRHLAPDMVPRLIDIKRVDIVIRALTVKEPTVARAYLQELRISANDATEHEKDWLADEPRFVPVLGNYLKSRDVTLRRISSEIVEVLSKNSPFRSGRMMAEGIGRSLAWVSVNGEKGAQHASIHALATLFSAAPDHADQLVTDSLPALCDILEDVHRSLEVYAGSLSLLTDIARQSPHSIIIESGIIGCLIEWLSPQHSITNIKCRQSVFQICQLIAQNSDPGRKALIDDGILPVLLRLVTNHIASNVVNACKILNALAHTGTYRQELLTAGVKDAVQQITSPIRKSSLSNKLEKKQAQDAAKQVLATLKSTKSVIPDAPAAPQSLPRSRTNMVVPADRPAMIRTTSARAPDQGATRSLPRRSLSESAADNDLSDYLDPHDEVTSDGDRSFGLRTLQTIGHARRSTDPGAGTLRTRLNRLSEVQEDHEDEGELPQAERDYKDNDQVPVAIGRRRSDVRMRVPPSEQSEPRGSERLGEGSGEGSNFEWDERRRSRPPSYRTDKSVAVKSRRSYLAT